MERCQNIAHQPKPKLQRRAEQGNCSMNINTPTQEGGKMRTRDEVTAEMAQVEAAGRRMNRFQNEGGEGYDHTDTARIDRLYDELQQSIRAEWTLDVTLVRRAAWNAAVKAATNPTARAIERATGIDLDELNAAVKRHSIA